MSICSVEGCEREVKAKLLCDMHLQRLYRNGVTGSAQPLKYNYTTKETADLPRPTNFLITKCRAYGCNENSVGMGFCDNHYKEFGFLKRRKNNQSN